MYSPINEKLEKSRQDVYRLHKNNSALSVLKKELKELEENETKLKERFDQENRDLEKLQQKNILSLFYTVFGRLESKTKEKQKEVLAAKLHYDQCLFNLEDVRTQIREIEADNEKYTGSEAEYQSLYAEKEKLLRLDNGPAAQKIMKLEECIEDNKNNLREIEEAVIAGENVLVSLRKALNSLDSASDWGVFDMFAGGLVTTAIKHSKIDDATSEVEEAQHRLRLFNAELADVQIVNEICFETGGFLKFADFFFDGLIVDWFMQERIHESAHSIENVKKQVLETMNKLDELKNTENKIISELEEEMKKIIHHT
ncbi:hypothetical protein [Methanimicrococcus blatticola]|uniref:Uncharacterized protein n=1 Tax=Methanimicrococcus blatticola TaxID=91560 RepID=A0A484F6G6_9EURY|nr:hypothetical protein [Methanimicrococcus blatticola]MBZ3936182.1 hypothetical protein [Methanimicrococcus blatticola]MCC2508425.1 hypothetical protein [Methanimicrococcus blatticola]TDQ70122.1 hypothetical protein C7391_0460 [Methanimicrococcus blatticola]